MKCAVLGDPIAHSLSPVLHRAAYAELGLDWTYAAVRVPAGTLEEFLEGLDGSWRGLSLTMPLKRELVPLADEVSDVARRAGAANTLVLADGRRIAHNTDVPGAASAIRERYDGPVHTATILGGGATATSVGLALADLGCGQITVLARSAERAAATIGAVAAHPSAPSVRFASGSTGLTWSATWWSPRSPRRRSDPGWSPGARACPSSSTWSTIRGRLRWRSRRLAGCWSAAWTCSCTRRPCRSSFSPVRKSRSRCCVRQAGPLSLDRVRLMHLDTALACALIGLVGGWFVPAVIAVLPEPSPEPGGDRRGPADRRQDPRSPRSSTPTSRRCPASPGSVPWPRAWRRG